MIGSNHQKLDNFCHKRNCCKIKNRTLKCISYLLFFNWTNFSSHPRICNQIWSNKLTYSCSGVGRCLRIWHYKISKFTISKWAIMVLHNFLSIIVLSNICLLIFSSPYSANTLGMLIVSLCPILISTCSVKNKLIFQVLFSH